MKTTLLSMLCVLFAFASQAQVVSPAPSPASKIKQTVGLTDITVEYSRPSVKDRTVFGDLVPYDVAWRTGANAATKITLSTDAVIGGAELEKGSYALITVPGKEAWELRFYPFEGAGVGAYLNSEDEPIKGSTVAVNELPFTMESFMIAFDNLRNHGCNMHLVWENTNAVVSVEVPTEEAVMASIESTMAGPGANDYRAAAAYYLEEGKDLEMALTWINKCIEMGGERFWILQDKSEIEAGLGDYEAAVKTAERSRELAEESRNNDYIKINNDNIEKWSKM